MSYDLGSIKAPRLAGRALQLFTIALERAPSKWLLLRKLIKDSGIEKFRRRALREAPSVQPPLPVRSSLGEQGSGELPALDVLAAHERPEGGGFRFPSVADYARAYREGSTTPEKVAEALIAAVREADEASPPLRAIIMLDEQDVRRQARASSERFKAGTPLGIFDGVPVAVKDELDQVPYPTKVGTSFLGKQPATSDATVVARMRAAGALLFGKANMHEIGIGVTGFNPHHGTPRNPYNPGHYTGGSSSGPAAAVAAGLCPVAIGADGGGSIRVPSGLCGVFGLKATWGRISEHGAAPLCWSVAHVGPLAATARDAALAYAVMAGSDEHDPNSQLQPPPHLDGVGPDADMAGVRIGIYRPWFEDAQPEVVTRCQELVDGLCKLGAKVVEVDIPELDSIRVAHLITIASEMALTMQEHDAQRSQHGLDVRINLAVARVLTARDYVQAQRMRTRMAAQFASLFEQVDCIATPTSGVTAPPIPHDALHKGESNLPVLSQIMRYAFPANLNGMPGISVPAGYDNQGMPVGLQLMAAPWAEHLLLQVAERVESLVARRKPQIWLAPELGA